MKIKKGGRNRFQRGKIDMITDQMKLQEERRLLQMHLESEMWWLILEGTLHRDSGASSCLRRVLGNVKVRGHVELQALAAELNEKT